ncbi:SDR family oxidoreductase [Flexibacterium corallicola]|uniref:SDR family oxidoreductase n=1 Tax=Flexibacterium corallicola TaxID=3037259 RepID=UPI00286F1684|nr:SDR family oxidoreductase [Pseudovibrio sp. M1P-2-3]
MDNAATNYNSIFKQDLFKGQTIIVTGGGSGIGRCIASELASLGAHTVLIGRSLEKLETTSAEIVEDGGSVSFHRLDIRDEEAVRETVAVIVKEQGQIHGLVNNAGGQYPSPASMIKKRGFNAVVETNVTGGFLMSREVFLQSMSKKKQGAIVNIVADMWRGMPGMAHSGVARAGMQNLTKSLAVEWASAGVRVNAVAPGWIASSGFDAYDSSFISSMFSLMTQNNLARRLGTEAEVSAQVTFLLSPAAAFTTGQCIGVDGGAPLYTQLLPVPDHRNMKEFQGFHRYQKPKSLRTWEESQ